MPRTGSPERGSRAEVGREFENLFQGKEHRPKMEVLILFATIVLSVGLGLGLGAGILTLLLRLLQSH